MAIEKSEVVTRSIRLPHKHLYYIQFSPIPKCRCFTQREGGHYLSEEKRREFNRSVINLSGFIRPYQITVRLPFDRYRLSKCGCGLDGDVSLPKYPRLSSKFGRMARTCPFRRTSSGNWGLLPNNKADHATNLPLYPKFPIPR